MDKFILFVFKFKKRKLISVNDINTYNGAAFMQIGSSIGANIKFWCNLHIKRISRVISCSDK